MMLRTLSYLLIKEMNTFDQHKHPRETLNLGGSVHYLTNSSPFLLKQPIFQNIH